ncbi:secretin N-terminal domain-containing protein, partial [Acidovorax sp. HMWF018]|uniref:secretin N-terminal domain-containing protein n=1 Tax=Acidovorax sp. HMWF018 TaxID=2056855 RepID=UPI002712090B
MSFVPMGVFRLERACVALLLGTLSFSAVCAAPARVQEPVTMNFEDAEIDGVSRAMGIVLGRPIVVDPRVKGRITLVTDEAVPPARAYAMFFAVLRGLGYAVVESNGLLKVVPEADAKVLSDAVSVKSSAQRGDTVMTQVFQLLYENASSLVSVLRPLISPNNTISVNPGNNSLVITDYASNLSRLGVLIAALDTPSATDVEVIPLQHAIASELAVKVLRMMDTPQQGVAQGSGPGAISANNTPAVSVVPDVHANALLVRAPNAIRLSAVRALVARLDLPGRSGSNVHVLYLKNAEATRLATVLRAAFSSDGARRDVGGGNAGASTTGASVAAPSGMSTSSAAGSFSMNPTSSSASSQAATPVTATAQPSIGGFIQADPATNSLIVTAPEPLFRELRAVVDLLDTRRAQLYVESLVVEVDASKALDVGVQWKQIFNISSTTGLTLGTVATALESMSGTNILSTANVVTLDNEEAKIIVGQNVPFVTGSYSNTSSSS